MSALRSSVNRHTGETANIVMLGRELNTPADIMYTKEPIEMGEHEFVRNLQSGMHRAHELVRAKLDVELRRTKSYYDIGKKLVNFKVGDPVLYLNKSVKKNSNRKLQEIFSGPGVITEAYSPFVFNVRIKNRENKVFNHDMLKLCHDRHLPRWVQREIIAIKTGEPRKYCYCLKPEQGLMLQCKLCDIWVHGDCIGVKSEQAARRLDLVCRFCQEN